MYADIFAGFVDPIARLVASGFEFFYRIWPSYGVAIIMLTLVVMLLIAPLNLKAMRSQLAMASLAPELKKLKDKYPNPADRTDMNVEMMALYKEKGVHPLSGCLPLLLQMPIIFGLYSAVAGLTASSKSQICDPKPKYLKESSELYQRLMDQRAALSDVTQSCPEGQFPRHITMKSFGFDLAEKFQDVQKTFGFGKSWMYLALIVFMVSLTYFQQWQLMRRQPQAAQNKTMLYVMRVFPLIWGFIATNFPAALVLYWTTQSVFRIVQQTLTYRFDPVVRAHALARQTAVAKPNKKVQKPEKATRVIDETRPAAEQPKGAPTPKRVAHRRAQGGRR